MTERRCLFLVVLTIAARVYAQSSDVTQCVPEFQWSINSLGQTPCLVGSYLETLCSGHSISVNSLPEGNHYVGPTLDNADPCSCNSVTYSMISACAGCQDRLLTNYSVWTLNCLSVQVVPIGQFPRTVPVTTQIPSWATLNISLTNNTFSPTEAEHEAARQPTTSTTSSSSAAASTTTNFPSQSTSDSEGSSGLSSGAIAGITVGALIAVIVILLALFWMKLRSKKQDNFKTAYHPPKADSSHYHDHSKSLSDPASAVTPYTYSASEGTRRQAPSEISTMYTTAPRMRSVDNLIRPSTASQVVAAAPPASRGYTGAAEV